MIQLQLVVWSSQKETREVKYDKPMAWTLSPSVPSDDKCSPELLLRWCHDNGQTAGFQALSQFHSSLQWFSTQFVSIFYTIGKDSRSGSPYNPLIHPTKHPVQFGQRGAEPQCILSGPVTQLSHHGSLGQGGLSSICHLEKHNCIKGEGCDRQPHYRHPLLSASSHLLAPHLFHLSQNNRKTQENLWG